MPSAVDICNIALQNLGADQIGALDDDTPQAIECNLRYDPVRRAILEANLWSFATTRASLNELADTPIFGYSRQFGLPSDYIRMVATEEQERFLVFPSSFNGYITISNTAAYAAADDYRIERVNIGGTWYKALLTDSGSKNILYVYDNDDEGSYPPAFAELLAQGVAAAVCYRVTGSLSKAESEKKAFKDMLEQSATWDSQNGTQRAVFASSYVGARL